MGRSLNEAQNLMWLMQHAQKLADDRKVNNHLRKNVKHAFLGGSHGFVATFAGPVEHYLRGWGPEKLGKLVACGAAGDNPKRTPMSVLNFAKKASSADGSPDGMFRLRMLAIEVLLAALYDVTVVTEGGRRSQRGMHHYEDNGRKCYHGPSVTVVDNGRQMEVPNPYWRPEAVDVSVIPDVRIPHVRPARKTGADLFAEMVNHTYD